jgi:hypothetical protein
LDSNEVKDRESGKFARRQCSVRVIAPRLTACLIQGARDFERQPQRDCLGCIMAKLIALVAAGLFAAGTMFAGEHGDCTKKVGNDGKAACQASLTSLDLTADQQTKMDAAMADHHKAGCSKESEATYMKEAKGILTKEQYAKFKSECKGEKDKTHA